MKYMIYESAITPEITNIAKTTKGLEFVTVLQEADVKNRNGRIYPKSVLADALNSPIIQEHLNVKHDWFGEVGHPACADISRQTQIDLNNVAFRINEIWWEGNLLKGKCETLNNARGRDMAGLIEQGCLVSFSLRAQGNVARDPARDALVVQSPLAVITFDWVALPSHQNAYLETVCEETKEAMFNYNMYATSGMALNESMNLYENGALIELEKNTVIEKPMIDFYSMYGRKIKTINEMYVYSKNDKVVEINDKFVILENDECKKKVALNDYLLKSTRDSLLEVCAGIAPTDCGYGAASSDLKDSDEKAPEVETADVIKTVDSSTDVEPSEEYQNPMEAEVKKELGDEPKNVSAEMTNEEFDAALNEEIETLDEKWTQSNMYDKADSVINKQYTKTGRTLGTALGWFFAGIIGGLIGHAIGRSVSTGIHNQEITKLQIAVKNDAECQKILTDIKAALNKEPNVPKLKELKRKFALRVKELKLDNEEKAISAKAQPIKEEFYKYYNIISEETGLTEEADIIAAGVKYSYLMPENCAYLFKKLAEEGEQ